MHNQELRAKMSSSLELNLEDVLEDPALSQLPRPDQGDSNAATDAPYLSSSWPNAVPHYDLDLPSNLSLVEWVLV